METLEGALNSITVTESAYRRIKQMILTGRIPVGTRLDERKLSQSMEVSRTPVRDAVGKLFKEGLVEYRPHQGNYVRRLTVKEINDLYVVRKELEALAVRLAAERLTPAHLARLRTIIADSEVALEEANLEDFGDSDRRMHEFFIDLADNATITEALGRIELLIQLARNLANKHPGVIEETNVQRHELYELLVKGDIDGAVQAMRDHIESVRAALVEEVSDHADPAAAS